MGLNTVNLKILVDGKNKTEALKKVLVDIKITNNLKPEFNNLILKISSNYLKNKIIAPAVDRIISIAINDINFNDFIITNTSFYSETNILKIQCLALNQKDAGQKLLLKQYTRKDAGFKKKITLETLGHSLAVETNSELIIQPELKNIKLENLYQQAETNLNFLNRILKKYNAVAKIINAKLIISRLQTKNFKTGQELPKLLLTNAIVLSYIIENNFNILKYNSARAIYRDIKKNTDIIVKIGYKAPTAELRQVFACKSSAEAACVSFLNDISRVKKRAIIKIKLNPAVKIGQLVENETDQTEINGLIIENIIHYISQDTQTTELFLLNNSSG